MSCFDCSSSSKVLVCAHIIVYMCTYMICIYILIITVRVYNVWAICGNGRICDLCCDCDSRLNSFINHHPTSQLNVLLEFPFTQVEAHKILLMEKILHQSMVNILLCSGFHTCQLDFFHRQ